MALNGNDGDRKTPTEAEVYSKPAKPPTAEDLEWRKRDVAHLPWEMQLLFRAVREMDATAQARWEDVLPRLKAQATAVESLRVELVALTATIKASFDELEQHTLERVARVEGAQVAAAESADRTHRELWRELTANRRVVNQVSGPDVPDLRDPDEITKVRELPKIQDVVKQELLQQRYNSAHDKLKAVEESHRYWTRYGVAVVLGGGGALVMFVLGILATLFLKR